MVGIEPGCVSAVSYNSSVPDIFQALSSWTPRHLSRRCYPSADSFFDTFLEVVTNGPIHNRYPRKTQYPTVADLRLRCQATIDKDNSFRKIFHIFKEAPEKGRTWLTSIQQGCLGLAKSRPHQGEYSSLSVPAS